MFKFLNNQPSTDLTDFLIDLIIATQVSEDELLEMNLNTAIKIYDRYFEWDRRWDYRFANINCTLHNIHRDPKKQPKPFKVQEFVPTKKSTEHQQLELGLYLDSIL